MDQGFAMSIASKSRVFRPRFDRYWEDLSRISATAEIWDADHARIRVKGDAVTSTGAATICNFSLGVAQGILEVFLHHANPTTSRNATDVYAYAHAVDTTSTRLS